MAGGYVTPTPDVIAQLTQQLATIRQQVRELQRPDGSQLADAVATLTQLVDDLPGQVFAVLATAVNTGTLTTTGAASIGGLLTANPGITSSDVRSRVVTTGYVSVWVDSSGRIGNTASSLRFKQDVEPADTAAEVNALFTLGLVRFRYISDVDERGDEAPWHLGTLAEYMAQTGLAEWVALDEEGEPFAINWEHIGIPLIAAAQDLNARVRAIEQRLDGAGL